MIKLFQTEAGAKRRAADFTFPVKVIRYLGVYVIQSGRGEFKGTHNYLTTHDRWMTGRLTDLVYIGLPGVKMKAWERRTQPSEVREQEAAYHTDRIEMRLVGTTYGREGRPTHHVAVYRKDGTRRLYAGTVNISDFRDPTFNAWGTITLSQAEKDAALNSNLVKTLNH